MFGAAAAAGALAGLREREVRYLLSFTAQQASGVSCWMRDGEHIEKAFDFGGMPARNGVAAATMVAHGFTGVDDVFAGERNFFVAYGRKPDPTVLTRGLGAGFEIRNTNIKRWSVGSPIQAPLDSLCDLIRDHQIKADEVVRLVVRVAHQGANTVDNRAMPDICMQHMCAIMLIDGKVTFASSHDEKRMRDRKVLALRSRIELMGDDALSAAMPSRQGIVEVTLRDGRELKRHTKAVRGSAENPMTRAEVDEKCCDLIAPVIGRVRAQAVRRCLDAREGWRCAQPATAAPRLMRGRSIPSFDKEEKKMGSKGSSRSTVRFASLRSSRFRLSAASLGCAPCFRIRYATGILRR
jgi:2-methylcitrate dehydratase PrpD